jgi:hypothetical protein
MGDLWEKVARLLAVNTRPDLNELSKTVERIIVNLLENPSEDKYRRIKTTNAVMKARVMSKNGALELLTGLGFNPGVDDSGEKFFEFPQLDPNMSKSTIAVTSLKENLDWLKETVETIAQQAANESSACAEYVVQIRLPTGAKVSGGFTRNESILAVESFARTYFEKDREDLRIVLRQPHDASDLANQRYEGEYPSLERLGIGKRSILLCTTLADDAAREERLVEKRQSKTAALQNDQIKLNTTVRSSVVASRDNKKMLAAEREMLTRQFEEDRKNFRKED